MAKSLIKQRTILAGIDIGSTKVCCLIAEPDPQSGDLHVLGFGQHATRGIKNGIITDMEVVETALLNAVHAAEKMADLTIQDVFVNISGNHLLSEMVNVNVSIGNRPITEEDIQLFLHQITNLEEIRDFEIIHAFPVEYNIDGKKGILDPRGMLANTLTGTLHVMTADQTPVHNLVNCIHRCHLGIRALVVSPIASGLSTLVEDEMELGVTVLDIGGGTTDISIFSRGNVVFTDSIPLGGRHITNDLAHGLSTSLTQAERLKTLHGSAIETAEDDKMIIPIPQMGEDHQVISTPVKRGVLTKIIQPRMEEILEVIKTQLEKNEFYKAAGRRIVLTGGASQLAGLKELASQILGKKIRLGRPLRLKGVLENISPALATCAGLLIFAMRDSIMHQNASIKSESWLKSLSEWIKENF